MAKIFGMISKALSTTKEPDTVLEVPSKNYSEWPVWRRDHGLLVYKVEKKVDNMEFINFEIVLQSNKEEKFFSLFRTESQSEAETRFNLYTKTLPHFLTARQELGCSGSLQKLCDCVRDHPDYGLCHLAVSLDMVDLVAAEDRFRVDLNLRDTAGVTALMVAASTGSKHLLEGLVSQGASITEGCDIEGSNVFHYIARKTVSLLDIVSGGGKYEQDTIVRLLNTRNSNKVTPLHIAAEEDKPDMVAAMLGLGADINLLAFADEAGDSGDVVPDVASPSKKARPGDMKGFKEIIQKFPKSLYTKDIKLGGTPLHWATDKPFMDALIELGCEVEARNSLGNTALHTMILHQRLECLVCLLSHGAEVNSRDRAGSTPLHLAVEKGHLPSIQALLVFGADHGLKNAAGDTAWVVALKVHQAKFSFKDVELERNMILHTLHSVGAQGPSDLTPTAKEFDWKPPVTDKTRLHHRARHLFDDLLDTSAGHADIRPGSVAVLSMDGGGIRGLVLAKLLHCLTQEAGQKVTELFSWITGTSTGGIMALALATGKSPMECQMLYFKFKDKVFVGNRPYAVEPLEEFLKKEMSETLMMTDLPKKPHIAVTGVLADRFPADLHFFRNYTSPMDLLNIREDLLPTMSPTKKPDQQTVWRAARSSGAAPTYFRQSGRYIDGGLIANNPTLDILTEIHELNTALQYTDKSAEVQRVGLVVSLGTGDPPVEKVDNVDLFRPDSILSVPSLMYGMSNMGRLLVDQASSSLNRVVDRARAWCSMTGIAYYRLSPLLASDINLAETNDEVLVEMLWMTQAYMYEQRGKIRDLIEVLRKCS